MYAVIKTGGKQYRVAPGQKLKVEKIDGDEGASVDFDQVLMVSDGSQVTVGDPLVAGGNVSANIVGHGRHKKIEIIKFKRRQHYRRQAGHRQHYTEIEITGIGDQSASTDSSESTGD